MVQFEDFFQAHKQLCCMNGTTFSIGHFRVAQSLEGMKKSLNWIGPSDRLLQDIISFELKDIILSLSYYTPNK